MGRTAHLESLLELLEMLWPWQSELDSGFAFPLCLLALTCWSSFRFLGLRRLYTRLRGIAARTCDGRISIQVVLVYRVDRMLSFSDRGEQDPVIVHWRLPVRGIFELFNFNLSFVIPYTSSCAWISLRKAAFTDEHLPCASLTLRLDTRRPPIVDAATRRSTSRRYFPR